MSERLVLSLLAAAAVAAGCSDSAPTERARPDVQAPQAQRRSPPSPEETEPSRPRGPEDRSNEAEAADMVRGALSASDRRARVTCRSEHEAAYSFNRYRCMLGKRRFLVRWQQYGSGEYRVSELVAGRSRIIARGIASFGG